MAVLRGHHNDDQELGDGGNQLIVRRAAVRTQCGAIVFGKAERPFSLIKLDPAHHAPAAASF